jgi:hypothetical protein
MLLTLGIYAYDMWSDTGDKYTLINSYPIRMTNRRFGLMKRSPSTHFRRLAAAALRDAFQALDYVDCVHILMQWEGQKMPYKIRFYGPRPPAWSHKDYYSALSRLSQDITSSCVGVYGQQFEQTKSKKPYRFRRKGVVSFVNYGGEGRIVVDHKNREIHYDYDNLSAKRFSRTLMARYMAHHIDWQHVINIAEVYDKAGLRQALENLEIDTRMGGGSAVIMYNTRALLGMMSEEVALPF